MEIKIASSKDIPKIHQLAHQIWPSTYQDMLTAQQIEFMLSDMYSYDSLQSQFNEGSVFLVVEDDQKAVAFASYSISGEDESISKIHKLYILPQEQGKGTGTFLTNFIRNDSKAKGAKFLELNVNRKNPAYSFYKKYGFEVVDEVDIPYFGFVLNDYVMRLTI
jgi:diamine N-acetyltransferase